MGESTALIFWMIWCVFASVLFWNKVLLYLAVEGKKEFIPSSLENEEPDEELRREKMRKMAEKIRKVISVEKIQNYVNRYLAER